MWVKICGVTTISDVEEVVAAGADAVGINLVPGSPRGVELEMARRLLGAAKGRIETVAVVADPAESLLSRLLDDLGFDWVQLHGSELPEQLLRAGPRAFKACRVRTAQDVAEARAYAGVRVLVDSKVEGALGGTGEAFDWSLVEELARERDLVLAGGLTPENVERAIRQVSPFGVDVASGVEGSAPGRKDSARMRAFVQAAREASPRMVS